MTENVTETNSPTTDSIQVEVSNLGGIDHCDISLEPGITILTGRNATNRTSLLRAIAGAFGGSQASLKSDADSGWVELTTDEDQYRKEYTRRGASVVTDGTPFSDSTELVDSFACLLENNRTRRTVEQGDDLRDVLMGPVDTGDIERQVREVDREIDRLDDRIERIERRKKELPDLERKRTEHRERLEELESDIEAVEAEIDENDVDESEAKEAEQVLEELEDARSRRRRTEQQLQQQQDELERLRDERSEVESALSELSVPDERLSQVEAEIERLEDRKRNVQNDVANLTEVIQFNEELLSGEDPAITQLETDGEVTASLDPMSAEVECWTCGSQVELGRIEDRIDGLRDILVGKRETRDEIEDSLSELRSEERDLEREIDDEVELEQRLDEVEREIEHRERKADELEETLADLDEEIEAHEATVEETEELRDNDLVDDYQRLSELEYERGQAKQRLDAVESEIAAIEDEADERDDLEAERADLRDRREELRTYIDDLEREIVERFNDHMAEILSILSYENIARVWIERVGTADATDRAAERFELHVVRETDEGAGYEDVVDNLSESERETIGLVVGLVGYLVHDVYEKVPIMLHDSLEAIDADRIARLVDYFAEYASYLVVALLPEDEQAIATEHDRVPADQI